MTKRRAPCPECQRGWDYPQIIAEAELRGRIAGLRQAERIMTRCGSTLWVQHIHAARKKLEGKR